MSLRDRLFEPVNIAPLVLIRIGLGAILFWSAIRYLYYDWVRTYYIEPSFYFKLPGFEWVEPAGEAGMYALFVAYAVAALFVLTGAHYRIAMPVLTVLVAWVFLIDLSHYLNHMYFVLLLGLVLCVIPANGALAYDARSVSDRRSHVPAWMLWLVRFQVGIVYFFGGIAKLDADWIRGEPMHLWLRYNEAALPFQNELWFAQTLSWMGLIFDLLVVPALLWRRTRWFAVVAVFAFNLMNAWLWDIGIFPWLMLLATVVFFPPDSKWLVRIAGTDQKPPRDWEFSEKTRRVVAITLSVWCAFHVLMPIRHFAVEGTTSWHEVGHRFSWRMKLRDKQARSAFFIIDKDTDQAIPVDLEKHLTYRQNYKMRTRPDMVCQFARHLAEQYRDEYGDVEIRALVSVALNGRKPQFMVDREVDLSHCETNPWAAPEWVIPFEDTELQKLEDYVLDQDQD